MKQQHGHGIIFGSHVCYAKTGGRVLSVVALRAGGWLYVFLHARLCTGATQNMQSGCACLCMSMYLQGATEMHKCKEKKNADLAECEWLIHHSWTLVEFLFPLWLSAGQWSQGRTAEALRAVKRIIWRYITGRSWQLGFMAVVSLWATLMCAKIWFGQRTQTANLDTCLHKLYIRTQCLKGSVWHLGKYTFAVSGSEKMRRLISLWHLPVKYEATASSCLAYLYIKMRAVFSHHSVLQLENGPT